MSHPTMGAWIEIMYIPPFKLSLITSHPTMGAWIEIQLEGLQGEMMSSRTPRWVRGLKFSCNVSVIATCKSHPTMGAWIEIVHDGTVLAVNASHPTMGAWIEILHTHRDLLHH